MIGRRREDGVSPFELEPGDYCKRHMTDEVEEWEMWYVRTPDGEAPFYLANEHQRDRNGRAHVVEEHEDGTISVLPHPGNGNSIQAPNDGWHGWLRRGEWVLQA